MKTKFTILLSLLIFFTSCNLTSDADQFYISNPTDDEISVIIDDNTYVLKPNTSEKIKLSVAAHQLTYNGKTTKFNVTENNKGGIINPTLSPHYIFTLVYTTNDNTMKFRTANNPIYIDGVLYEDHLWSTDALFIDNNIYLWANLTPKKLLFLTLRVQENFSRSFLPKTNLLISIKHWLKMNIRIIMKKIKL